MNKAISQTLSIHSHRYGFRMIIEFLLNHKNRAHYHHQQYLQKINSCVYIRKIPSSCTTSVYETVNISINTGKNRLKTIKKYWIATVLWWCSADGRISIWRERRARGKSVATAEEIYLFVQFLSVNMVQNWRRIKKYNGMLLFCDSLSVDGLVRRSLHVECMSIQRLSAPRAR